MNSNSLLYNILVFFGFFPKQEELGREKNITPRQETPQEAPASCGTCEVIPAEPPIEFTAEREYGPDEYIDVESSPALQRETLFSPAQIRSLRVGQKIRRRAHKRGAHLITFKVHAVDGLTVWLRRPKGSLIFQAN